LLSYDLFNEPENDLLEAGAIRPIHPRYVGTFDFIVYCANYLRRRRPPGPAVPTTVGFGGYHLMPEYLRELQRRGYRPSYVSLHFHNDWLYISRKTNWASQGTWDWYMSMIRREAENVLGTGVDLVCSEFYAPYHQHERAMRGHLQLLLNAMRSARIGGQIWNVLESNFFAVNPVKGSPTSPVVEPQDGLLIPHDFPWGVNGTRFGDELEFRNPAWLGIRTEIMELLKWTNGAWPIPF
jgi:hypothetical protein